MKRVQVFTRQERGWVKLPEGQAPRPPEGFSTQWTHEEYGDICIEWKWVECASRPGVFLARAVRAVVQPTLFAEAADVTSSYRWALRTIRALLARDGHDIDVPDEIPGSVVGRQ